MQAISKYLFSSIRPQLSQIPTLKQFLSPRIPQKQLKITVEGTPSFHIETYGCQMNTSDSQIVRSLLTPIYNEVNDPKQADIVILNTCAIRESAQQKIYQQIRQINSNKVIAILGCMAQRLKDNLFKVGAHVVCGPDAYRDLPRLLSLVYEQHSFQMNVQLSSQQTYADITPVRTNSNSVTAFISIMRGCNNMCSFCIVPFVRGRQRSRNVQTILTEIEQLENQGVKQITFLGQNVNSYHDTTTEVNTTHQNSQGFQQLYKLRSHPGARFSDLLESAACKFPNIRFRFTSPHPKDFPPDVLNAIAKYPNICKYIHLPAQSGSSQVLMRMRRNHSREAYLQLVKRMRQVLPDLTLSTDLICGFCGETEQQFEETLELIREVKFDMAFLFAYSMRERTHAHRNYQDDVPEQIKLNRLARMIDVFVKQQSGLNQKQIGKVHLLLLESKSKREAEVLMGKTDNFKKGYAKIQKIPLYKSGQAIEQRQFRIGDYLAVRVQSVGPRSLQCRPLGIASSLSDFHLNHSFYSNIQ